MAQIIGFSIVINGVQTAISNQQQLTAQIAASRAALATLPIGSQAYNDMSASVGRLTNAQRTMRDAARQAQQQAVIEAESGTRSYRSMSTELNLLRERFRSFSEAERNSNIGRQTLQNIQGLDRELRQLDANMGQYQRNVGNYASAFTGGIGNALGLGLATGGGAALAAAVVAASKQVIDINLKINESQADVQKTTGLSQKAVEGLTESLKSLDTKTSLNDLLKIGAALGQLGVEVNTRTIGAIDKLAVALGGELGANADEVATKVGKLRNVLKDSQTSDISNDFLRIGNALNVLGATGAATADVVADISQRIAGGAGSLGLSSAQIFGISAALQELGVDAERAGSGVNRIFNGLTQSPESFAKKLGLPIKEFTKLVETDLFGAFELVSKKIKEQSGSNVELAKTLKELKLDGQGEIEVFNKLGGSIELLDSRVKTATSSLKETSSVMEEFNTKNETLGAIWSRAWNKITESVASSGLTDFLKGVGQGLSNVIDLLGKYTGATTSAADAISKEKNELAFLITNINKSNVSSETRANLLQQLQKDYPDLVKGIDLATSSESDFNKILAKGNQLLDLRSKTLIKEQLAKEQLAGASSTKKDIDELTNLLANGEKKNGQVFDNRNFFSGKYKFTDEKKLYDELDLKVAAYNILIGNAKKINDEIAKDNEVLPDPNLAKKIETKTQDLSKSAAGATKAVKDEIVANSIKFFESEIAKFKAKAENTNVKDVELQQKRLNKVRELEAELKKAKDLQDKLLQADLKTPEKIPTTTKANTLNAIGVLGGLGVDDKLKRSEESITELLQSQIDLRLNAQTAAEAEEFNLLAQKYEAQQVLAADNYENQRIAQEDYEKEKTKIATKYELERERIRLSETQSGTAEYLKIQQHIVELESKLRFDGEKKSSKAIQKERSKLYSEIAKIVSDGIGKLADFQDVETTNNISRVEKDYNARIELADGNVQRQKELEKELNDEKRKIEIEAFERNKRYSEAQVLINGGLAITRILADTIDPTGIYKAILVAATIAETAAQIAIIEKSEFKGEQGFMFKNGFLHGNSHSDGGMKGSIQGRRVELEGGEFYDRDNNGNDFVINRRSAAANSDFLIAQQGVSYAGKSEVLSSINSQNSWGTKFAQGGAIYTPQLNGTPRNAAQQIDLQVSISSESINQMAKANYYGTSKGVESASEKARIENNRDQLLKEKINL